jgi:hypothetical protein
MYRVGFGDFFLVIVPTRAGDRYIVIDVVTKGHIRDGRHRLDRRSCRRSLQNHRRRTSLVIMTHRHAGSHRGFSRAERFKDFTARMVWMPYWAVQRCQRLSP